MEPRAIERGGELLQALIAPGRVKRPRWDSRVIAEGEGQRLIVEYSLNDDAAPTARPSRRLIAKFFSDGMGARSFSVMRCIASALDALPGQPPVLAIPQAYFYDPDLRLQVQQRVRGTAYPELLARRGFRIHLRLAGQALSCLHSLPVSGEAPRRMAEHMAELMRPHPLRLAEALPEMRVRVEGLVSAMLEAESRWPGTPPSWLHRDVHMDQLFRYEGRVWLIDWDLAAVGDPAVDVGNFLLQIRKSAGDRSEAGRAAFLEGYAGGQGAPDPSRIAVYEAFNCLRRACKRYRVKDNDWRERMLEMLAAADRCMEFS